MNDTGAERQARWRARREAKIKDLEQQLARYVTGAGGKLEAENAKLADENAILKAEVARLKHELASKPKAAKPPPTPDEARERTIKGLRTRIRNLQAAVAAMMNMPRATKNAILQALHPDPKLS